MFCSNSWPSGPLHQADIVQVILVHPMWLFALNQSILVIDIFNAMWKVVWLCKHIMYSLAFFFAWRPTMCTWTLQTKHGSMTNEFTTLLFQWSKCETRNFLLIFYFQIMFNSTHLMFFTTANGKVCVLDQPGHFQAIILSCSSMEVIVRVNLMHGYLLGPAVFCTISRSWMDNHT